ncbi:MAG TPA: hypothetical protein VLE19_02430, partial [Pyrinomonadaceae bacterium]|nr:hypothetical protein [Pyrinomonadaceae bacterium]
CTYCGVSAGFFNSYHPECKQLNEEGWAKMVALATETVDTQVFLLGNPRILIVATKLCFFPATRVH